MGESPRLGSSQVMALRALAAGQGTAASIATWAHQHGASRLTAASVRSSMRRLLGAGLVSHVRDRGFAFGGTRWQITDTGRQALAAVEETSRG